MFKKDPRDPWVDGDNYEVNDPAFIAVKKTLIRLSHLASFPCDVNLWMPIAGHPDKIRVVIRNVHESGHRMAVTEKPGWVSVLAPVHNSLDDTVALVEVVSQTRLDAHENVK